MHDSPTGVETPLPSEDPETRAQRLQAMVEAMADRARAHAPQATSDKPPNTSLAGSSAAIESGMRRGLVPEAYLQAEWSHVRSPAVRQWSLTVVERTHRRSDLQSRQPRFAGRGLILLGPVGTGKSSAAALVCREAVSAGRNCLWQYVPDLVDQLSDKAGKRAEAITRAAAVDILVWDDFGVRNVADWELGYLDQIVERRYREFRPMVVTSNLTAADLQADVRLQRITDRWRERTASDMVVLSGESMRGAVPSND